jgi:hypothetical protein
VVDLRSPGWSEAEPWVFNVSMRPAQSGRGLRACVRECWDEPRCSVCYVPFNLTPLQGDSLLWDALPGVKTPGLRPLAPSGRRALNTHRRLRRPRYPRRTESFVGIGEAPEVQAPPFQVFRAPQPQVARRTRTATLQVRDHHRIFNRGASILPSFHPSILPFSHRVQVPRLTR